MYQYQYKIDRRVALAPGLRIYLRELIGCTWPIHQCPPQPFERAETKAAEPPGAEQHLRREDGYAEHQRMRGPS